MNSRQKRITVTLAILAILITIFSLTQGKYTIPVKVITNWIVYNLGLTSHKSFSIEENLILHTVRLPRIILASLVGGSLAISGVVLQSIFRNPLVSPFLLGISSGASLGASLVIVFFQTYTILLLQISAFAFAIISVLLVLLISRLISKSNPMVLVLSGVIVTAFISSFVSLLQYFSEDQKLQSILFWTFGSLNYSTWNNVSVVGIIGFMCLFIFLGNSWKINALSLGEIESKILGINPKRFTLVLILFTTLLTSCVTAICGPIGWVGLLIPHLVRFIGGSNNFYVLTNSFLLGSVFLQLVDSLSRTIANTDIPIGIITALLGLPFFLLIAIKTKAGL